VLENRISVQFSFGNGGGKLTVDVFSQQSAAAAEGVG
jgi:hypothetical protein